MSQKQNSGSAADRIRARLAGALAPELPSADVSSFVDEAAAREHFLGKIDQLVAGRTIQRIPVGQIAPDLRPDQRQPRLLPLPEDLSGSDIPALYREIAAELRALGQSLCERQIQPILVFPGETPDYPAARYLILVGQRRWTSAVLVGLEALDTVVVEPPSPLERVRLQYRENEHREDFSDMERAWALVQLRTAMGGDAVPMEDVAIQLGVKRARAYQLRRLLALDAGQQRKVALLRLQETQLRTLLDALHRGQIGSEQVDGILERLEVIAADRAHHSTLAAEQVAASQTTSPRQQGIDAPTVARLVARALDPLLGGGMDSGRDLSLDPRYSQLRADLSRVSTAITRASGWIQHMGSQQQYVLQQQLTQLRADLDHVLSLLEPSVAPDELEGELAD